LAGLGPILATMAWQWGFFGAARKAFVGDGSENNWTIWRQHFSSFVPILDFIHALSYVFAAAMAGRKFTDGWSIYEQWIRWVWQGEVAQVIAALAQRQLELGAPHEEDGDTGPRQIVAQALTYLQNHQSQMKYAEATGLADHQQLRGVGGETIQPAREGNGEVLVGGGSRSNPATARRPFERR
jgi:hypothetical protein